MHIIFIILTKYNIIHYPYGLLGVDYAGPPTSLEEYRAFDFQATQRETEKLVQKYYYY